MSVTTCPVFRPTMEEFSDFRGYIKKIEKGLALESVGICKIIPPAEWLADKGSFDMSTMPIIIENPIKQVVSGRAGVFNVDLLELKPMSINDFTEYDKRNSNNNGETEKERERKFWKSLGCPGAWDHPIYGADQIGTLFDEGGGGAWNVNKLDSIVNLLGPVPGVSSAYLYVGTWRSMFAYHVEDLDLYSINYLHGGAPKSWYSIKQKDKKRFESLAVSYFVEEHQQCHEFLRHKTKMFSPIKLKEYGIESTTVLHSAGEFIITFPGAYHAGFNHGLNVAESTNFATTKWFDIGKRAKRCICRPYSVAINVSRLETMYLRNEIEENRDVSMFHTNNTDDEDEEEGCDSDITTRRYRCICATDGIIEVNEDTPPSVCCSSCSLWGHVACYDDGYDDTVNDAIPVEDDTAPTQGAEEGAEDMVLIEGVEVGGEGSASLPVSLSSSVSPGEGEEGAVSVSVSVPPIPPVSIPPRSVCFMCAAIEYELNEHSQSLSALNREDHENNENNMNNTTNMSNMSNMSNISNNRNIDGTSPIPKAKRKSPKRKDPKGKEGEGKVSKEGEGTECKDPSIGPKARRKPGGGGGGGGDLNSEGKVVAKRKRKVMEKRIETCPADWYTIAFIACVAIGAVRDKAPSLDVPSSSEEALSLTAPIATQAMNAMVYQSAGQLTIGDVVSFQSDPSSLPVEGIITDIEDDLGRLHVKGTRKDLDIWISLLQAVLIEKKCGWRDKMSRQEGYSEGSPMISVITPDAEALSPPLSSALISSIDSSALKMPSKITPNNVAACEVMPSSSVVGKIGADVIGTERKTALMDRNGQKIVVKRVKKEVVTCDMGSRTVSGGVDCRDQRLVTVVTRPPSTPSSTNATTNSSSNNNAPSYPVNTTGISIQNLIESNKVMGQKSSLMPVVPTDLVCKGNVNSVENNLAVSIARNNVHNVHPPADLDSKIIVESKITAAALPKSPINAPIKDHVKDHIKGSLNSPPPPQANTNNTSPSKVPLPDHFFKSNSAKICLTLTAMATTDLNNLKQWLTTAIIPMCSTSLSAHVLTVLLDRVRVTCSEENKEFLDVIQSYGQMGKVSVIRSMAFRYLALAIESHPPLSPFVLNLLNVLKISEASAQRIPFSLT